MERTVTLGFPLDEVQASPVWRAIPRLLPLWRHAVWVVALFVLLVAWVSIRVEVQQARKDLDRGGRAHREASVMHDRLVLETDARRRAVALEVLATQLAVVDRVAVVRVPAGDR